MEVDRGINAVGGTLVSSLMSGSQYFEDPGLGSGPSDVVDAMPVVESDGGWQTGLGYTFADACIVSLITGRLAEVVTQHHALDPQAAWHGIQRAVRNMGLDGLAPTVTTTNGLASAVCARMTPA